jgi:uncharacterized circularly permuted ATP-grasp superfamily protein
MGQSQRASTASSGPSTAFARAATDPGQNGDPAGLTDDLFAAYAPLVGTYDELFEKRGLPRGTFGQALHALRAGSREDFARCQSLAELALLNQGVTFSVYADTGAGSEKIFPFCLLPRIISAADWAPLERGLIQRVRALSAFLDDVYGEGRILAEKPLLRDLVLGAKGYLPLLKGVRAPANVRLNISGIDLVRDPQGVFRVLEDNLRTPSGVSYVLENRITTKRVLPHAFEHARIRGVDQYPTRLASALASVAPHGRENPRIVVLTPGPFNSAYFEHSFLARTMGLELVQAPDLYVDKDHVYVRTTEGPQRVDVIYRRTDEAFLDPEVFRADSILGVPGLMRAYQKGNVALANAPGNGVADDKAVYAFVHEMIRFYLDEEPTLEQVPTYLCARGEDRAFVLEHLEELVVKSVDEAGGYGMLMGPSATKAERDEFRKRIESEPRKYIAQHRLELSSCPTWDSRAKTVVPRRVDLRPYILTDREGSWVLPGGLTRVALTEGSYVVNSSQGGGSKDTWVQQEGA